MRPTSLPKLSIAKYPEFSDMKNNTPYSSISVHSRESSGASETYSPLTPTFSVRDHSRGPSSTSSLATTPPMFEQPDSPTNTAKINTSDDLVEEPTEREDEFDLCDDDSGHPPCRCQTESCVQHNLTSSLPRSSLDYDLADGFCSDGEVAFQDAKRRRRAGSSPVTALTSRIGTRLPSLTMRFKEKKPTTSVSRQGVRSAPPSRSPSFRMSGLTKSLVAHLESAGSIPTPPQTPTLTAPEEDTPPASTMPVEISQPMFEEPIDRQAFSSTPLLPPTMMERRPSDSDSIRSPLQSPTVADSTTSLPFAPSPAVTPHMGGTPTPPLSTKPSVASFGIGRPGRTVPSSEIPPLAICEQDEKWANKLGHANFTVFPEPYMPGICDKQSCKRLLADWESARMQYTNQALKTREHYGPTSQTFKLTEMKWAEIDSQWRKYHDGAVAQAARMGEAHTSQTLAEPAPLAKIPSFDGAENSGKFPKLGEGDIVGPMVQYAKVQRRPSSKKSNFLKFFSDSRLSTSASGRSVSGTPR